MKLGDMETTEEGEKFACRCGHEVGHNMVSAEPSYSPGGWLAVLVGISWRPTRLRYRCRRCNEVFFETKDPATLATYY